MSRDGDAVAATMTYSSPEANSQRTCSASRQAEGASRADLTGSGGDDNGVQQQPDAGQPPGGGAGVTGGPGSAPPPAAAAASGDSGGGGDGEGQGVSSVHVRFRPAYRPDQQAPSKDRVRWTPELHQIFVDAVERLGGAIKAKPKEILAEMRVPELSLNHVKSHLQKHRATEAASKRQWENAQRRQLAAAAPGVQGGYPAAMPPLGQAAGLGLSEFDLGQPQMKRQRLDGGLDPRWAPPLSVAPSRPVQLRQADPLRLVLGSNLGSGLGGLPLGPSAWDAPAAAAAAGPSYAPQPATLQSQAVPLQPGSGGDSSSMQSAMMELLQYLQQPGNSRVPAPQRVSAWDGGEEDAAPAAAFNQLAMRAAQQAQQPAASPLASMLAQQLETAAAPPRMPPPPAARPQGQSEQQQQMLVALVKFLEAMQRDEGQGQGQGQGRGGAGAAAELQQLTAAAAGGVPAPLTESGEEGPPRHRHHKEHLHPHAQHPHPHPQHQHQQHYGRSQHGTHQDPPQEQEQMGLPQQLGAGREGAGGAGAAGPWPAPLEVLHRLQQGHQAQHAQQRASGSGTSGEDPPPPRRAFHAVPAAALGGGAGSAADRPLPPPQWQRVLRASGSGQVLPPVPVPPSSSSPSLAAAAARAVGGGGIGSGGLGAALGAAALAGQMENLRKAALLADQLVGEHLLVAGALREDVQQLLDLHNKAERQVSASMESFAKAALVLGGASLSRNPLLLASLARVAGEGSGSLLAQHAQRPLRDSSQQQQQQAHRQQEEGGEEVGEGQAERPTREGP